MTFIKLIAEFLMKRIYLHTFILATLLTFVHSSFASAQESATITPNELRAHVKYLASDELEGRRAGTRGNLLAAGYIAGEFARSGLEPVGGTFLHDFSYLKSVTPTLANSFTLQWDGNGDVSRQIDRHLRLYDEFTTLGFSSNGNIGGEIVFVGYGISAPDKGYDDYSGIDVEGKIVLMLRYSPPNPSFHDEEKDLSQYAALVTKALTAREKGAAGMILIDMDDEEGSPIPTELMRGFTDVGMPVVSIIPAAFNMLKDPGGRNLVDIRKMINSNRTPNSFTVAGWRASITTDLQFDRVDVPNVLGMVPGNDPALRSEVIVIGAHFDHLGHGGEGSLHGDSAPAIHNGADDNASGTAAVMALARYYALTRSNKRTLIFSAFNGEEEGLLGSAALVENSPFELKDVLAMINLDMVGRLGSNELVVQGTGTSIEWDQILERANKNDLILKTVKDGYGPSDHSSFYAKQIPVLFFFTGLHSDYHRPSDDWELVNYDGIATVANLVRNVVATLDTRTEHLTYVDVPRTAPQGGPRLRVVLGIVPDYGFDGKGLRLSGVSEGGPAQKGGIQHGDIIIKLNGKDVNNIEEYMYVLASTDPDNEVEVVVLRDGESLTVNVMPQKR